MFPQKSSSWKVKIEKEGRGGKGEEGERGKKKDLSVSGKVGFPREDLITVVSCR